MKAWIAILVAALIVAPLILVAILLGGIFPQRPAPPPVVQAAPVPPPAPAAAEVPHVDVRADVARLLDQLCKAALEPDLEAESRIQSELQALGFPAIEPMRIDPLGNPEASHRDFRFQKSVVRTLMGMASPETGIELLKTWNEVDQSKYAMSIRPALFILGQYAPVVAKRPAPDLGKRILKEFREAKTRDIRLSLIELMGQLLSRFPDLRDELMKIMLEDGDKEVRGGAIAALSADNPAAALPAILKRLEDLLAAAAASSRVDATKELWCLVDFLVKALPFDQALDRLKELSDKSTGIYVVNALSSMGFAIGNKLGGAASAELETFLTRAVSEKSRNMQLIYLGALSGLTLQPNPDHRATDMALSYLENSKDEWVRSHALSMITGLNRDEATVLGAIERAIKSGGNLTSNGGMQLAFYCYVKNPASSAALEMIRRHVTTGERDNRLTILKRLCVSSTPMPASVREIVKAVSESDPDEQVREMATKVLNWTGGPPPH